jgi:succinate dehydrogenase/fumarate reductase cytochrome b subunit
MWVKLIIAGFLLYIVYSLAMGCYYMLTDQGKTGATVKALTKRIGVSIALIVLIMIGIATGVIQPHGIQ